MSKSRANVSITTDTSSFEHDMGRTQGWDDGTHPSGIVTHVSHRDPEGWAEQSEAWQAGYEEGWQEARTEPPMHCPGFVPGDPAGCARCGEHKDLHE